MRKTLKQPEAETEDPQDEFTCAAGSIIECENQILGEALGLTGTPLRLHYRSDRVPGRTAANTLTIPLSGASVPASLKRIELEITVAGRRFTQTFPALPNQTTTFTWDGLDAYARRLQGRQPVRLRIGYVYPGLYQEPAQRAQSFGAAGTGVAISSSRVRQEVTVWQQQVHAIGPWEARAQGLGSWTVSVHHAYDPIGRVLYLGNGRRQSAQTVNAVITTVAGTGFTDLNGDGGFSGDGGPATQARLNFPEGVAVGPDGSLYIADNPNHRVRRVGPDGIITTVAGTGSIGFGAGGFSGDGGPATQANLSFPESVAVAPDGGLYIGDSGNRRVRRVGPDGVITTVAGNGSPNASGDGGPATQAGLFSTHYIALGPDCSLYITDGLNERVRRVGPDGIITTVAGSGFQGFGGDGGPATQAALDTPAGLAVGPDGSLYIADFFNFRVRRVRPDGIITTVAGTGRFGFSGDGGPATQAQLFTPERVAVAPDGSIYIGDAATRRIRRVDPSGIITTVAGSGTHGFGGDGGPATQAQLAGAVNAAVAPDGSLYLADTDNQRVRRVTAPLPGFGASELAIASADGRELYRFAATGQHLSTVDTLTGALLYRFTYDPAGRLIAVEDGDGKMTRIERDGAGNATAIVAPGGQRTTLSLDANGSLASVTNLAGEATRLTSTADGLLATLTDPKGNVSRFAYDALGRLIRDDDAAGGFSALARTEGAGIDTVARTTAAGRVVTHQVERLLTGGTRRVTTEPTGLQTVERLGADGTRTITSPDGTVTTLLEGPDPRFGMQAPLPTSVGARTPGGRQATVTTSRTAALADPANPLSLTTRTDTVTVNGRAATSTFNATLRTITDRTPAGRQIVRTLDALGRLAQTQAAGLEPVSLAYDLRGRLASVTEGSGFTARVTTFSYDLLDRLASVADPAGQVVQFTYDLAGRVTTQTLPDGRQVGFAYDANGNVTAITPPGSPAHGFAYTPVDLEASYSPPALPGLLTPSTSYAYNTDRQLTVVTRPEGQQVTLGYDAGGRLATITQPRGITSLAYHPTTGQVTTVTAPGGGTLSYTYDGALVLSEAWGGPAGAVTGSVGRSYDNDFRLASESVNGANAVTFAYDADSLPTQAGALAISRDPQHGLITGTTLGSLTNSRSYTSFGELASYQAMLGTTSLFSQQYTRDALGRITSKTETVGGVSDTLAYAYDAAGRLTEVRQNGLLTASYTYDTNGNRLSRTTPAGTITGTYDAQDRLLAYGEARSTYTANGELATKTTPAGATTYTYDLLGNLTAVSLPDGTQIEYLIDGLNRRVGKKVNGALVQAFLYRNQLKPVAEIDGAGNVVSRFVYGTSPLVPDYVIKGGVNYQIVSDHLGSPRLVVDTATGTVVQRLDYDEFGNIALDTNPGFQPFGFAGGLYDTHTTLTRFGLRDYDPEAGRWTTKDPARFGGRSGNLYDYVFGDPINLVDPTGLAVSDCQAFVDSLATLSEFRRNSYIPRSVLLPTTGQEIVDMYVPPGLERRILGRLPGRARAPLQGATGFRQEVVAGGQGTGVGHHVAAAAGAVLENMEFLIDIATIRDALQPTTPGHPAEEKAAEIAANKAGRQVGRAIREFLQTGLSPETLRTQLMDTLCEDCP